MDVGCIVNPILPSYRRVSSLRWWLFYSPMVVAPQYNKGERIVNPSSKCYFIWNNNKCLFCNMFLMIKLFLLQVGSSLCLVVQGCDDNTRFTGKPGLTMAVPPCLVPFGINVVTPSSSATLGVLVTCY